MDQCPGHISGDLWRASGTLRVKVNRQSELARNLESMKEDFEEEKKQGKFDLGENEENLKDVTFAEKEGDSGYKEKSEFKSLEIQISDIITAWGKAH